MNTAPYRKPTAEGWKAMKVISLACKIAVWLHQETAKLPIETPETHPVWVLSDWFDDRLIYSGGPANHVNAGFRVYEQLYYRPAPRTALILSQIGPFEFEDLAEHQKVHLLELLDELIWRAVELGCPLVKVEAVQ